MPTRKKKQTEKKFKFRSNKPATDGDGNQKGKKKSPLFTVEHRGKGKKTLRFSLDG